MVQHWEKDACHNHAWRSDVRFLQVSTCFKLRVLEESKHGHRMNCATWSYLFLGCGVGGQPRFDVIWFQLQVVAVAVSATSTNAMFARDVCWRRCKKIAEHDPDFA